MKKILFFIAFSIALSGCKSKLDEVTLNDNPYDAAYTGSKVLSIGTISSHYLPSTLSRYSEVDVTITTDMYEYVMLYRDGVLINTYSRTYYTPGNKHEQVPDYTAVSSVTYTYTAVLKYEEGHTQPSAPVLYTTP